MTKPDVNNVTAGPRNLRNLEQFKAFLGEIAERYSDAQLHRLQQDMFVLAEILLDLHLSSRRQRSD